MTTRADLLAALDALDRARGQIAAVLRVTDPAPAVCEDAMRRARGALRVLHYHEEGRRDRTSEEGRYRYE